jgi:hypothetical protein
MTIERQSDWPCIICGAELQRVWEDEGQPNDGVVCTTHGNYGSRVYDSLNGEYLAFNICDPCLTKAGEQGRIQITRGSIPVELDASSGICGSYPVDRPYVPWHAGMAPWDERFTVTVEEVLEGTYPASIRWNDGGKGNWPDMLLAGILAEQPDLLEDLYQVESYRPRLDALKATLEEWVAQRKAQSGLE